MGFVGMHITYEVLYVLCKQKCNLKLMLPWLLQQIYITVSQTDFVLQYVGGVKNKSFINIIQTQMMNINNSLKLFHILHTGDLVTTFIVGKNTFSTNIQPIKAKYDELKSFIEHLGTLGFELSAICTQESIIYEGHALSLLQLKGYNLIPQSKSCSAKGDLIIYLHETFKYDNKSKLNKHRMWKAK